MSDSEQPVSRTPAGSARGASLAVELPTCLGLFVAALAVRLVSWQQVHHADGILPFGNDAFYHLRRIQHTVANFPSILTFDPFINFPHGGQPIWPPTFDWLLAAGFRLALGSDQPERLERIAMLVPPVLGAVTVVALYRVAAVLYARGVALLAAVLLALLPAHFYYSRVGFLDHHVLVALVTLAMLAAAMALLRAEAGGGSARVRGALLGVAMAGSILVWPGALLHVGILQAALAVWLLAAETRSRAVERSRSLAVAHLTAALAVLPLCVGNRWVRWGELSPLVLSDFQPLYLGAAALGFAAPGVLFRRGPFGASRARRVGVAAAWNAGVAGLLLVLLPELRAALGDAWAWLAKGEAFQSAVSESAPLFAPPGGVGRAVRLLTPFVLVVPLAVAGLAWRARGRPDRLCFLCWGLALYAATLVQWRFMNSYALAHALLLALSLVWIGEGVARRLARPPRRARLAAALAIATAGAVVWPVLEAYRPHVENLARALRGEAPRLPLLTQQRRRVADAALWLRENSPPPEGAGYSVLGAWGDGHILKYLAQRPVVQDNFGDDVALENLELADAYFAARDEARALSILERTRTRYVLVRSTGSGHGRRYDRDSLFARLIDPRRAGPARGRPALRHHRLIYESPPLEAGRGGRGPFCRLYEIVAGARLVGRADPDAALEARLRLETPQGGPLTHAATARADATGRYELRVPYPSERFSPAVRVDSRYRLRSGAASASVAVPEAAVRDGDVVPAPPLSTADPEPAG